MGCTFTAVETSFAPDVVTGFFTALSLVLLRALFAWLPQSLLEKPLRARRECLKAAFTEVPGRFQFAIASEVRT